MGLAKWESEASLHDGVDIKVRNFSNGKAKQQNKVLWPLFESATVIQCKFSLEGSSSLLFNWCSVYQLN